MPNWITNRVRITGKPEKIAKVKKALEIFNDSEIEIVEGKLYGKYERKSYETEEKLRERLDALRKADKSYFTNIFDFNAVIPMPPHSDTFFATGGLGDEERKKYGKNNWYDWSNEHWGTKWNSSEARLVSEDEDSLEYWFDTAWGSPVPVIEELARKFGVKAVCDYYDVDDFPNTAGHIEARPRAKLKYTRHPGDLRWLAKEFGEDLPESYGYELVNGRWEYNEE